MDWKALPGYDEKYANVSIKQRKTFGGKVVTVLYGAKDDNGNPVMPAAGKEDGHGEWFGIEAEDGYRMFSLKHPASEGGAVEYGTDHGDHALEDMESDIQKKQDLCKRAAQVAENGGDLSELQAEYAAIASWNTAKDKEYDEWFARIASSMKAAAEAASKNAEAKKEIVAQAEALSDSQEWKSTQAKFRDLMDQWKEIGRAGDEDDALWDAFKSARKKFDEAREHYFANLDASRAENKAKKEELIAKAKEAATDITSYKNVGNVMNDLMDAWKAVKSAGHDADEELWAQFNSIRQSFYKERKEFFEKRDSERKESIDAKKKLIAEAKEIADKKDYSKETTDRMKQLDVEWKGIGYSGKNDNDRLWDEFKAAKDVFWNAKHENSQERFKTLIDQKDEKIKSMREQVEELEERVYQTEDFDRIRDLERRASEKKAIIEDMKKDIEDLKNKLDA